MDHRNRGHEHGMDVHRIAQVLQIPREAIGLVLERAGLDREHIMEHGISGAKNLVRLFESAKAHGYNQPPSKQVEDKRGDK